MNIDITYCMAVEKIWYRQHVYVVIDLEYLLVVIEHS